jgi:hypothetical protein
MRVWESLEDSGITDMTKELSCPKVEEREGEK